MVKDSGLTLEQDVALVLQRADGRMSLSRLCMSLRGFQTKSIATALYRLRAKRLATSEKTPGGTMWKWVGESE